MNKNKEQKFEFLLDSKEEKSIEILIKLLRKRRFQIVQNDDFVEIYDSSNLQFYMRYIDEKSILTKNRMDKVNKKIVKELRSYPAKLEISFNNLDDVLQEYNSLSEIQEVLLSNFSGTIYLHWNQRIIENESI